MISELLMKRLPSLCTVSLLVADLENSVKVSAELPPEEYFELINDIWGVAETAFRKHHALAGKHVGDGVVRYFMSRLDCPWQHVLDALLCAVELQSLLTDLDARWRARKHWANRLCLNIGLHEGREWFGYISATPTLELTVLGDAINVTSRLSDFARGGAVWTTKHFLSLVPEHVMSHVDHGIYRQTEDGRILVPRVFSRILDLVEIAGSANEKLMDIANVSVTEIVHLGSAEAINASGQA